MATSRILGLLAVATLVGVMPASGQQVSTPANRDRRLITAEEIEQAQATNTLEVVQKLRPEFLRRASQRQSLGAGATAGGAGGRTSGAGTGATGGQGNPAYGEDHGPGYSQPDAQPTAGVFVDGSEAGGIDELRQIPSNTVEEIRYLSGTDAQTKYGPRFPAGVIEVTLKTH
ncbi:MAG TPA: hypothetical protein VEU27_11150 [Gemmatimonadales bacterium]|nr:hypothetical protein [Gemmatimonadales bacterium]